MQGFRKEDHGADGALALIRIAVAVLLFVHGVTRLRLGGVVPFGGWLDGQGIPLGLAVAWFVTVYELVAAPLLAIGIRRFVTPLCIVFATIYAFGIWLVHWPEGWFVVGAGRNGMEYSVLLIVCLLALAWRGWGDFVSPRKRHWGFPPPPPPARGRGETVTGSTTRCASRSS